MVAIATIRCPLVLPQDQKNISSEFLDALNGVINIAVDICVCGCGDAKEESDIDHDQDLTHLLEKCKEHDLRLSAKKIQLKSSSVSFMGCRLTNKGVQPDPSKVAAITGMPTQADRLDGRLPCNVSWECANTCSSSAKTSQTVIPLRDLTRSDTEFLLWKLMTEAAFKTQPRLSQPPQQPYYNVILQRHRWSFTSRGPSCLLYVTCSTLQKRIMLRSRKRALQLCPVWRNGIIIYLHDIMVHSDHQPLETIFKKHLSRAPGRTITSLFSTREEKSSLWPTLSRAPLSD